jgi:hypothetical protein
MGGNGWRRGALGIGYGLGAALIGVGVFYGELALVLAGLVLLAVLLVSSNG